MVIPEIFYELERNSAKAHADNPLTQEYIERLETVAKAAYAYWSNRTASKDDDLDDDLNDALATINFMDDTI